MQAESIYEALRGVPPDPNDRVARDVYGMWLHLARAYALEGTFRASLSVIAESGSDGPGCANLAAATLGANPSVVEMAEPIGAEVIIESQRREISALRRRLTLSSQTTLLALSRAVGSQAQSYRDWLIRCRELLRVVPTSTAAMQKRKAQVLAGLSEVLKPESPIGIYEEVVEGKAAADVLPFGPRRIESNPES